jgi:hypothetical protein
VSSEFEAAGYWLLDNGCWILVTGFWLLDTGYLQLIGAGLSPLGVRGSAGLGTGFHCGE